MPQAGPILGATLPDCHPFVRADDRYIHPQQEAFSIQLISPVSWEAIPNAR